MKGNVWDKDLGGVRLLSGQCATCIYRPGNPMRLEPGRLQDITASAREADGYVICHDTLSYGEHPETGEALCRGFYDAYQTRFTQVGDRLSWWREIPPPGLTQGEESRD
jgi:hypothetical protein